MRSVCPAISGRLKDLLLDGALAMVGCSTLWCSRLYDKEQRLLHHVCFPRC